MIRTLFWRFVAALQFFTRLPLPRDLPQVPIHQSGAIGFFPWAGLVVGLLCGAVLLLARWLWPPEVAAVLAVAAAVALTGALHEDGLSDTVDGFGAGWDRMHILAIMKDVRLGNYGATALILALAARIALTAAIAVRLDGVAILAALMAAHAVSRGTVLVPMLALPYARAEDATSRAKPVVQDWTARHGSPPRSGCSHRSPCSRRRSRSRGSLPPGPPGPHGRGYAPAGWGAIPATCSAPSNKRAKSPFC